MRNEAESICRRHEKDSLTGANETVRQSCRYSIRLSATRVTGKKLSVFFGQNTGSFLKQSHYHYASTDFKQASCQYFTCIDSIPWK